jgi:SAM-dependent methyltransferase
MELTRAQQLFDQLFSQVQGFQISRSERQRLGREEEATTYGEVLPPAFHELISAVSPKEGEVFVDLGSGTGKAVFLAAMLFPFRHAIGVELLPGLGDAARQVLARYDTEIRPQLPPENQQQRIEFIDGDLLQFDLSGVDVVFGHAVCYDKPLLEQFTQKLESLKPGARVACIGPQLHSDALAMLGMKVIRLSWGTSLAALYQRR